MKKNNFYYTGKKKIKDPEHVLQCEIKEYIEKAYPDTPFISSMIGVYLTAGQVVKQKAKGAIKSGYPDLYIFDCRGGFGGFMVELKAHKKKVVKGGIQEKVLKILHQSGYRVRVLNTFEHAKAAIDDYMSLPLNPNPNANPDVGTLDQGLWYQGLKEDVKQLKDKSQIDDLMKTLAAMKIEEEVTSTD